MKSSVTIALVPAIKSGPWVFWHDLENSLSKAAGLGFDAVELFTDSGKSLDTQFLTDLLNQLNLSLAAVGTGAGKVIHGLTLTDPDPQIRSKAIAFITDMISFGANFNAPAIIGSMQGNSLPGQDRQQALNWLAEGLNTLGKHAFSLGVKLIYEPLNRYETNLINDLESGVNFIRTLDTENVFLLADLFHMNIEEVSVANSIRQFGQNIGHVHLADSNRRPGGLGHIPMKDVAAALREIGYTGYVSAEAFPYPTPDEAAAQTIQCFNAFFR